MRPASSYTRPGTRGGVGLSVVLLAMLLSSPLEIATAERPPLTKNVPIWEFQNVPEQSSTGYDFNAPPKGLFREIQFAESFDQKIGFRQTYDFVPVNPTEEFKTDARAVYIVFQVHEHYDSFQVWARCYPEEVEGLSPSVLVAEDAVQLTLEDNTGYLRFFPPTGGWKPGRYRVEIHVGWEVSPISLMGMMRFTVVS